MSLQFKEGIQLTITQAVNKILRAAEIVYAQCGVPCVVTSGTDGQHRKDSKHYTGHALDLRIFHLKPEQVQPVVQGLQKLLGEDFDIILERDHIHVEFDPKVKVK